MDINNYQYLSNENKAMIWQLLNDNKAFSNIPDSYLSKVKELYEDTFKKISAIKNIKLVDKNKMTIGEIMKNLSYFKTSNVSRPLEEVQLKLDSDFENKQSEFIQLIKRPTPEEVNFEDKNDIPLDIKDMDKMLHKMMEQREKELDQIQQENPKTKFSKNNNVLQNNNDDTNESIGSEFCKIDETNQTNKTNKTNMERRVSFPDNATDNATDNVTDNVTNNAVSEVDDFIFKLKRKNTSSKHDLSIDEKLNKLLINQEKILNKLDKLTKNL